MQRSHGSITIQFAPRQKAGMQHSLSLLISCRICHTLSRKHCVHSALSQHIPASQYILHLTLHLTLHHLIMKLEKPYKTIFYRDLPRLPDCYGKPTKKDVQASTSKGKDSLLPHFRLLRPPYDATMLSFIKSIHESNCPHCNCNSENPFYTLYEDRLEYLLYGISTMN